MLVRISRNYSFPNLARQTPKMSFVWDGIEFTEEEVDNADFLIILNQPAEDIKCKVREGGVWLMMQEPPAEKNEYFRYHFRFVDRVYSDFKVEGKPNFQEQTGLPWHIGKSYDELIELDLDDLPKKKDKVSWITSTNNMFKGHEKRLNFIDFLKKENFDFDLYGRGFNPIDDKFDGIAPYKYSIAVENYFSRNYWTEKAIDAWLSWSVPIYYGCTNMNDFFPKNSFIQVDLDNPKRSLEIIQDAIKNNFFENHIQEISEARLRILNEYQLFPSLKRRIDEFIAEGNGSKFKNYRIPKSGLTKAESIKKGIRNKFKI